MHLVAVMLSISFGFATITRMSSGRARSCGPSRLNHEGDSRAETTGNQLANRRCTTLVFLATNTPARSCFATR
jgi:hypothetical protein